MFIWSYYENYLKSSIFKIFYTEYTAWKIFQKIVNCSSSDLYFWVKKFCCIFHEPSTKLVGYFRLTIFNFNNSLKCFIGSDCCSDFQLKLIKSKRIFIRKIRKMGNNNFPTLRTKNSKFSEFNQFIYNWE